jgi:hypothetical protein
MLMAIKPLLYLFEKETDKKLFVSKTHEKHNNLFLTIEVEGESIKLTDNQVQRLADELNNWKRFKTHINA